MRVAWLHVWQIRLAWLGQKGALNSRERTCCADMVMMGRRKYDIAQLTGVLESLGTLHYDNDVTLDRLSQHIMQKLPDAGAKDLVQLVRPCSPEQSAVCVPRALCSWRRHATETWLLPSCPASAVCRQLAGNLGT